MADERKWPTAPKSDGTNAFRETINSTIIKTSGTASRVACSGILPREGTNDFIEFTDHYLISITLPTVRAGLGNVAVATEDYSFRVPVALDAHLRHEFERLALDPNRLAHRLPVDVPQFARIYLGIGRVLHARWRDRAKHDRRCRAYLQVGGV